MSFIKDEFLYYDRVYNLRGPRQPYMFFDFLLTYVEMDYSLYELPYLSKIRKTKLT